MCYTLAAMKQRPKILRSIHLQSSNKVIYLEIGSSQVKVMVNSKLVFNQPSCIAINPAQQSILAFGDKAYQLLGKRRHDLQVVFPIKNGAVANREHFQLLTEAISNHLHLEADWWKILSPQRCIIAMSDALTPAEKEQTIRQFSHLKLGKQSFFSSELAVAMQADRCHLESSANYCLINMGGMITTVAIVQRGELTHAERIFVGGVHFTAAVQHLVRSIENCAISWHEAERVKKNIGFIEHANTHRTVINKKVSVTGKDIASQLGKTVIISAKQASRGFGSLVDDLVVGLQHFFNKVPPEQVTDCLQNGVFLTGGAMQLTGMREIFQHHLKAETVMSDQPELDVVMGLEKLATRDQ